MKISEGGLESLYQVIDRIKKERGSRYYLPVRVEKKRTMESLILAQDER